MFQFNVPEKDISVNLENLDEDQLSLLVSEATIYLSDQVQLLNTEFETLDRTLKVAESYEALVFSLETYGPQDATLALFNGTNNELCSLLDIEDLPTAEQWKESGYTEVTMEGVAEAARKVWDKIVEVFKSIIERIKKNFRAIRDFLSNIVRKLEKEEKRLKGLDSPEVKDKKIKVSPIFSGEDCRITPSEIKDIVGVINDLETTTSVSDIDKIESNIKSTIQKASETTSKATKKIQGDKVEVNPGDVGIEDVKGALAAVSTAKRTAAEVTKAQKKIEKIEDITQTALKTAKGLAKEAKQKGISPGNPEKFSGLQYVLKNAISTFNTSVSAVRVYVFDIIKITKTVQEGKKKGNKGVT